jgi:predicted 2-oxoglutarate/Fe(II)-dependent dioxygenase YbiX
MRLITQKLTRWKEGSEMSPHSDNSWPNGNTEAHPTSFRTWSGIYYINDDYEGGEIYFPELDWNFKPKADTLLMFPSTSRYIHGVNKVTKGTRYTVACWYTNQYQYLRNLDGILAGTVMQLRCPSAELRSKLCETVVDHLFTSFSPTV